MTGHTEQPDPLGEVLRDGDRIGLRYVRHLAHPIERVWRALTESDQLRYWMPCDIVGERRAGAAITLPFWPAQVEKYGITDAALTGTIEVWEPLVAFQWTWDGDMLRFDLASNADGTTLTFTTWPQSPDPDGAANAAGGYHVCLAALQTLLDTGSAPPLVDSDARAIALRADYAAAIARSSP